MTKQEFNKSEIAWAQGILQQPEYKMPNGKSSHLVAYEVMNRAIDRMIDENHLTAHGTWA